MTSVLSYDTWFQWKNIIKVIINKIWILKQSLKQKTWVKSYFSNHFWNWILKIHNKIKNIFQTDLFVKWNFFNLFFQFSLKITEFYIQKNIKINCTLIDLDACTYNFQFQSCIAGDPLESIVNSLDTKQSPLTWIIKIQIYLKSIPNKIVFQ